MAETKNPKVYVAQCLLLKMNQIETIGVFTTVESACFSIFNWLWDRKFITFETDDDDPLEVRNNITSEKRLEKFCKQYTNYLSEWSFQILQFKLNKHIMSEADDE
jgi:hypothetical protein